jgi:uncharacterized protein (TIGR00730 family)
MIDIQSVCVFLGSSTGSNPSNAEATVAMAEELVRRDITVVYGGGNVGLMGLLANTALAAGGRVIGIIPRNLFTREVAHQDLTELIETDTMHERKALMYERSDAFAALPGGFGTLDELAEISTWRQLGTHAKPVGLLDVDGYYQSLLAWLDRVVDDGLLSADNRSMLHSAATPGELLDAFSSDNRPTRPKWDS